MVAVIKHGAPPPKELYLAWQSKRWHSLPLAGGLLDQPAGLLDRMAYAENVYETIKAYQRVDVNGMKEWIKKNPDAWELVLRLGMW